jgi:hypothetical protein
MLLGTSAALIEGETNPCEVFSSFCSLNLHPICFEFLGNAYSYMWEIVTCFSALGFEFLGSLLKAG